MKQLSLSLDQTSIYFLACYQMGRFFADDTTAENCMIFLNNIGMLKNNMDEETLKFFAELSKQFESKHADIKERFSDNWDELEEKFQVILYGK